MDSTNICAEQGDFVPLVLAENHPLLEKFQKTLKDHLLRVQAQLLTEIEEIDFNLKIKDQERVEIGEKLYDRQQELNAQNQSIEQYAEQYREISEKRIKNEKKVEQLNKIYEEKNFNQKKMKRQHNESLLELSSLQNMENNIQKWSQQIQDEVGTAKRIVSKDEHDQQQISEEKKKMDILLFKMDTEILNRDQELYGINEQIKEQDKILGILNGNLSDATSDLEILQQEEKRLTKAWNQVIVAIQNRDKILCQTKESLRSQEFQHKSITASIESVKKTSNTEMRKNEELEAFKARIDEDVRKLERQVLKEQQQSNGLHQQLEKLTSLMERTEKDFATSKSEGNVLEVQLRSIQSKVEKLNNKKIKFEEDILDMAQNQLTASKTGNYRMKSMREIQDQRRNLELSLTQTEKQISDVLLDMEKWKSIIIRLNEEKEHLTAECNSSKLICDALNDDMKAVEVSISQRMKSVDQLTKKLNSFVMNIGGVEKSPTEIKISSLERLIQEIGQQIQEQQNFWLLLQKRVVDLAEKRSAQTDEIQIARKQLMIIEQKTLKIDTQLLEAIGKRKEIVKTIQNMNTRVDISSVKLFEAKKSQEVEEEECQKTHTELVDKLREAERSVLKMEEEIDNITKDIEAFKDLVLERHREALSWETKYKMVEELNRWRTGEKNTESEIGTMRAEIHRMEIRYNHLKRAQEKLVQDLEHCVIHREKIYFNATQYSKLDADHGTQRSRSRSTVQHKLNELKSKMKQIQTEISKAEKNLSELANQYQIIFEDVTRKQDDIENEMLQNNLIQSEIEQGMLLKYQNLDNIVRKQHRTKRYRSAVAVKALPKCKSETTIEIEMVKQRETNDNLIEISQNLLNECPEKKYFVERILQTAKDD